jgi:hypothetical protein
MRASEMSSPARPKGEASANHSGEILGGIEVRDTHRIVTVARVPRQRGGRVKGEWIRVCGECKQQDLSRTFVGSLDDLPNGSPWFLHPWFGTDRECDQCGAEDFGMQELWIERTNPQTGEVIGCEPSALEAAYLALYGDGPSIEIACEPGQPKQHGAWFVDGVWMTSEPWEATRAPQVWAEVERRQSESSNTDESEAE